MNESSLLAGNVTGDASVLGLPLNWVETERTESVLIALACCLFASMLSLYNIHQHLQHYSRPQLQRYIVRILVIVPVYAVMSVLSLKFVNQALYFDTLRDCYEAYVVYSFLALVLSFAGGESVCVLKMQSEPDIVHAWPLNLCLNPIGRDGRLLRSCKRATIQFVLIKPFFAALSLLMLAFNLYHTLAYQLVLTVVYNISYSMALYGLWLFYLATKHILKSFNPVLKFFAVKSIIFLTFWQSSMIDFVPGITNEQSFAWKDFILCLEMVPFAIVHFLAFNSMQFKKNLDRLPDSEVLKNMKEVLSLADLVADAYHNFMPSYQEYMLQRADQTSRGPSKSANFGEDGVGTTTEGSPTPMAHANGRIPRFVIDDEDEISDSSDEEEEDDLHDLEAGQKAEAVSVDAPKSDSDSAVDVSAAIDKALSPSPEQEETLVQQVDADSASVAKATTSDPSAAEQSPA